MTNCFSTKKAGEPWLGRSVTSGSRRQTARTCSVTSTGDMP